MEDKIQGLIDDYKKRVESNKNNQRIYHTIHYCIGYPQILCASILTFYSGANEFNWRTALGVLSTLLSVSLVFFNVQEKANKFNSTKQQYRDLIIDLEDALALDHIDDYETVYDAATEKEKFITAYETSSSICCDYFEV